MEDKNKNVESSQRDTKTGSGSILAASRKQQNRTVEEIADELNLSVTQIKTIELDQSEGLPEPTYVRGYIRSYAKLLGLDAERVLESYLNPNWQQSTNLDDLPKGIGRAEESDRRGVITPTRLIVLIVIAASLGFLWYSGLLDPFVNSRSTDSNQGQVDTRERTLLDDSVIDTASVSTLNTVEDGLESPQEVAGDTVQGSDNVLELSFAQTSWVDIRDSEDNRLAYKSYAEGEELSVSSPGPMSVFIGNAEGVSAKFNQDDFDISEYREGVYAKFTVGNE